MCLRIWNEFEQWHRQDFKSGKVVGEGKGSEGKQKFFGKKVVSVHVYTQARSQDSIRAWIQVGIHANKTVNPQNLSSVAASKKMLECINAEIRAQQI